MTSATDTQSGQGRGMAAGEIRVLHVEDEERMRRTTARMLEQEPGLSVLTEASADAALDRLEDEHVDCIVSDYWMDDMDGIEFLKTVRERYGDIPFIIYTGKGSEDVASEAISAGVSDYLQKRGGEDEFAVLVKQITNIVERDRAIKRFRSFLESAPDAIVIVDADGMINQVNGRALELFGYDRDELIGKEIEQLLPSRYRDEHRVYREEYFQSPERRPMGADLDLSALRADGTEFPVDISISPITIGQRTEVMASIRDISTRKWHEQRLREEQALTKSIFSELPEVFYATSLDGSLLRWNDRLEDVTGYDAEDLEGMKLTDLVPEPERETIEAKLERVLEDGRTVETETQLLTRSGETISHKLTGGVLKDADGEVFGVAGVCHDITERAELRRELNARLERITDGFVTVDHDWRFTYMNRTAEEILSVDGTEVIGETAWDVLPDLEETEIGATMKEAKESNEPTSVEEFFEPLDKWFELRVYPSQSGLSVYFRDMTEQRERQRRYEAIFDQTYQFTGLMEPDGTLIEANQTALEFGGLEREEVVGKPIWETGWFQIDEETPDRVKDAAERAAEGEFVRFDLDVQGANREAIIDFSIKPVYDDTGDVTLLVPEGRDITELKRQQRELERQNKRLDEFASVVSHDLRNPLTVARTNLRMARDKRDDEYLEDTAGALERMNELIDDLLTLARKGMVVSQKESVSLETVAEQAWRTVETEDATFEIAADPTIQADPDRLRELLENLYRNAVEHGSTSSPSNGQEDTHITVGGFEEGFFVADNGPGIPPEKREQVFEAGFTTDKDGNGFGLAIVRNIAQAHGWDVRATESSDGGARFEVCIDGGEA